MTNAARVLAVDDDRHVLRTLTEFLKVHGYEVVTAQSAREAYVLMEAALPDVVLLDVGMPDVDGMTVLRHIRMTYPELPVIMLTGNVDPAVARYTMKHGAFYFAAKPFDFAHLTDAIAAALAYQDGNRPWRA